MSVFMQEPRVLKVSGMISYWSTWQFIKYLYWSGLTQSTLDATISRWPKPPTFTTDVDYIIELVVSEDEVSWRYDWDIFTDLFGT